MACLGLVPHRVLAAAGQEVLRHELVDLWRFTAAGGKERSTSISDRTVDDAPAVLSVRS